MTKKEKIYRTKYGISFAESALQGKNPYSDNDDKLAEYFAWNAAKYAYKLDQMTPKERSRALKAKRALERRMDSANPEEI